MALTKVYVQAVNRIPELFQKIKDAEAPSQLIFQLLKDWGFRSSNDRAFIPLLKALGFLSPDGVPTQKYQDYRDHSRSKKVLGDAIKNAYGDIFLITAHPTASNKSAVEGKFKSFHNVSDNIARLMSSTFFSLLALADISGASEEKLPVHKSKEKEIPASTQETVLAGLHYNVEIHLPATKDVEVYNSIFKSLKEHLLGK